MSATTGRKRRSDEIADEHHDVGDKKIKCAVENKEDAGTNTRPADDQDGVEVTTERAARAARRSQAQPSPWLLRRQMKERHKAKVRKVREITKSIEALGVLECNGIEIKIERIQVDLGLVHGYAMNRLGIFVSIAVVIEGAHPMTVALHAVDNADAGTRSDATRIYRWSMSTQISHCSETRSASCKPLLNFLLHVWFKA